MTTPSPLLTGVYGTPPHGLAAPPAGALQLSPLHPGSTDLADAEPGSFSEILVHAPPGTLERRHVLATALRALAEGGRLAALAPGDRGGSRLAGELTAFGCHVEARSKSHHRIVSTLRPATPTGLEEAMSEGGPRLDESLGLWTQPGVFSWDRVDPGTRLLCSRLPMLAGRGADLGSGIGVLAAHTLASPAVTRLDLIDIDRRAVAAARRNIHDPRAHHLWADATTLSAGTRRTCDFVVMNPPFHAGGQEDKALGQAFIRAAAAMLRTGGVVWLVANRHLPYEAALAQNFRSVRCDHEAEGFKILTAQT
jgi:16S rRNA (guanine1207-N2)-methyltransferase